MKKKKLMWFLSVTILCSFLVFSFSMPAPTLSQENSVVDTLDVDWALFWQRFRAHSIWDLECDSGAGWFSVKSDLQVVRAYPQPNHCKITLVFDASYSGNYRLTFAIDRAVRNYVYKTGQWNYTLEYEEFKVVFDWSDVLSIPNLQISHGVLDGFFWFRLRRDNVSKGAHVEIDPSIVATDVSSLATTYAFQRKTVGAQGRIWVFYSNGTNILLKSSTTGETWSDPTTIRAGLGYYFSIWANTTHFDYAYTQASSPYDTLYRRGQFNSDGTITWATGSEQVAHNGVSGNYLKYPTITVDSNGYPWISALASLSSGYFPQVTKSSKKDGTWTTATGFPYNLTTTSSSTWMTIILSLSQGKTYAVYARDGYQIKGKMWNGSAWQTEENATTQTIYKGYLMSAIAKTDDIHLTFLESSYYDLVYAKRVYVSGWQTQTIDTDTLDECYPTISLGNGDDFFVFWQKSNTMYYRGYINGAWKPTRTWFSDSVKPSTVNSFPQVSANRIGVVWTTATSPFTVKFQSFTLDTQTVGPFIVKSYGYAVSNGKWDDVNRVLSFTSQGDITVDVGDYGIPLRVETDNELFVDWTYDSTLKRVTLNNVASQVEVIWRVEVPHGGGSGYTPTPAPLPTPLPPTVLPPIAQYGAFALVGIIGVAVLVSQVRKQKTVRQLFKERTKRRNMKDAWKRKKRG